MNNVISRIKAILESKGMSVRELGRLTGIPQSTLNRYLTSSNVKITLPKLKLIATALGVEPSFLMGWSNKNENLQAKDTEKLSEEEKLLLDLFNQIPEDQQSLVLQMIRVALKAEG